MFHRKLPRVCRECHNPGANCKCLEVGRRTQCQSGCQKHWTLISWEVSVHVYRHTSLCFACLSHTRSVGYGSLSIWTHNLRGVEYLPSFEPTSCPVDEPIPAARAAAGTTGIEAQVAVSKHGSILVTGANPDVGIVGWLTGGGHGPLSSTYGMGADNLLEATIVTPTGEILVANPCQNSDLFFAIRGGGGGTYGVVTEVVVKTYPDPQTTKVLFQLSTTGPNVTREYWEMVGFIHAEMQRMKEGGLSGYYFVVGPPTYPVYAFLGLFAIYNKPNGTMEKLWAPIVRKIESQPGLFQYASEVTQAKTFLEAYSSVTNEQVADGGSAYASWLLSPKSLENADVTAKVFSEIGASVNASEPNVRPPSKVTAKKRMLILPGHIYKPKSTRPYDCIAQ